MSLTNDVINEVSQHIDENYNVESLDQLMVTSIGKGLGIAAVQISVLKRMIIITVNGKLVTVINPVITKTGKDKKISREGCLSFPNKFVKKQRWYRVTVEGISIDRQPLKLNLYSTSSFVAQHEIDHLNGIHI